MFVLQFTYFNAVEWRVVERTIIAPTKMGLIRAFIEETKQCHTKTNYWNLWYKWKDRVEYFETTITINELIDIPKQ